MKNIIEFLKRKLSIILLLVVVLVSFTMYFYSNNGRLGTSRDSMSYISTAENIKDGNGIKKVDDNGQSVQLFHFPPGVSITLSAIPLDTMDAFYVLNALCYVFSISMVFLILKRITGSNLFTFIFSLLWSIQRNTVEVFSMAWSEPLFIALSLMLVYSWLAYSKMYQRRYLILIILISAVMPMVRYAGLFILVFNAILFFIIYPKDKKTLRRIFEIVLMLLVTMIPYLVWSFFLKSQGLSERSIGFEWMSRATVINWVTYLGTYILPVASSQIQKYVGLLVTFAFTLSSLLFFLNAKRSQNTTQISLVSALYAVTYLVFLMTSMLLFDHATPFDFRILSLIMPYVIFIFAGFFTNKDNKVLRVVLSILFAGFIIMNAFVFMTYHTKYYPMAHPGYDNLRTITMVKEDSNVGMITNGYVMLYSRYPYNVASIVSPRADVDQYWIDLDRYISGHKTTYLSYILKLYDTKKFVPVSRYSERYTLEKVHSSNSEIIYLIKLK